MVDIPFVGNLLLMERVSVRLHEQVKHVLQVGKNNQWLDDEVIEIDNDYEGDEHDITRFIFYVAVQ